VDDQKFQRVLEALSAPVRAILQFLQPFVQPEKWRELPYNGDWTRDLATLQAPQFRKDPLGRVDLRGWAKTATGASSVIAVLPIGYRPNLRSSFPAFRLNGTYALARIDVDIDGRVLLVTPAVGAADELSLNGISFDVGA
jgi:hypothetical protein